MKTSPVIGALIAIAQFTAAGLLAQNSAVTPEIVISRESNGFKITFTGTVLVNAPRDYRPDLPDIDRQARFELGRIRQHETPSRFRAAIDLFQSVPVRAVIEAHIESAEIDEPGRANALRHVTAFYDALASLVL